MADHSRPSSYVCICGCVFTRRESLRRHLNEAGFHCGPMELACPEPGCERRRNFTRVANFRIHYMKMHGKSDDEAYRFLQEWKSTSKP
ncbi:hypothetical protein HOY80DRAFT_943537, partial [Tuber brumale]